MALKNVFSNGFNVVTNNLQQPAMPSAILRIHKAVLSMLTQKKRLISYSAPSAVKER